MARPRHYRGVDGIPDLLWPALKAKYVVRYFIWREVCHASGSLLLLTLSIFARAFVPYPVPVIVFVGLVIWMTYQEFYLHPKLYKQKLFKGILDWSAWVLPFVFYFIAI